MSDEYRAGQISLAAGTFMLKWELLNRHVHINPIKIQPGDDVNIFINLECVLRNLYLQKGLQSMVTFSKQHVAIELESSILNLMAMYRMYFKKEKCNPRLYFYLTDLGDNPQQMEVYNKYYRSFYKNKYTKNPQFRHMGDLLTNIVLPEIELILLYVPGCYLLKSKTFDSSVIPMIVSEFSDSKNVIVSGDVFDTLYLFNPNFMTMYIKRLYQHFTVTSEIDETVQSIVKEESPFDLTIFNSEMYYRLLLAVKGSKIRNIQSTKGFGYGRLMNVLRQGMSDGIVMKDFKSIDSILELFPENYRKSIKEAFQCTSIDTQYELLSDSDKVFIRDQIVDKIDMQSLDALNNKRFLDFPINLQGLVY